MHRLAVKFLLMASRFVLDGATDATQTSTSDAASKVAAPRRPPVRTLREPRTRASRAPATCRAFAARSMVASAMAMS